MTDLVVPMASPDFLQGIGAIAQPRDLAHLPLLRSPLESWITWFRAAGLDWPEPTSGPKLVDLGMTIDAAVAGQGIALVRPSLAENWIAMGRLRPIFNIMAEPSNQ